MRPLLHQMLDKNELERAPAEKKNPTQIQEVN